MVDREKLKARLRGVFVGEMAEHVAALNRDLLALEQAAEPAAREELVHAIFRTAHTLKGAARSVSAAGIERVCHEMESLFETLRTERTAPGPVLLQALFAATDAIEASGRTFAQDGTAPETAVRGVLAQLAAVAAERASEGAPAAAAAAPSGDASPDVAPADAGPVEAVAAPVEDSKDVEVTLPPPESPAPEAAPHATAQAAPEVREPERAPPLPVLEAPEPERAATPAPAAAPDRRQSVRVRPDQLDVLLRNAGELAVARRHGRSVDEVLAPARERLAALRAAADRRGRLGRDGAWPEEAEAISGLERELDRLAERMRLDRVRVDLAAARLEDAVRTVCMQPFSEACNGLDRTVRDVARGQGKNVSLVVEGSDVLLDRSVLSRMRPMLTHLVRNAVDHGIETPASRAAVGKPERATLTLGAAQRGAQVEVSLSDDGRGIDVARVVARARDLGATIPEDPDLQLRLIFHPGLSTAARVTEISGRGVGLDAVKADCDALHGRIDVRTQSGAGTKFVLSLPLSAATFRVLLVEASGSAFALVTTGVERLLRVRSDDLPTLSDRPMVMNRGRAVPVATLAGLLGLPARPVPSGEARPLVLLSAAGGTCALQVDRLLDEQEIVLRDLGTRLRRVPGIAGAAVLPDGRIALVLATADLVDRSLAAGTRGLPGVTAPGRVARHLIVADDSVTTRMLVRGVLEEAGYTVTEAVDGAQALELLEARGADLVVSDVEMPRMDGLSLTRAIRRSGRLAKLPVVLVTSLESAAERQAGLEAGASAYLRKSAFDQDELLETIGQLI